MIKYITVLDTPLITLDLMGRKKTYKNSQEVHEDAYTKAYPQYFKKIGEIKGYGKFLATPIFIPIDDPIKDFVKKEEIRKTEKIIIAKNKNLEIKEVKIEQIADIEDIIEDAVIETEE